MSARCVFHSTSRPSSFFLLLQSGQQGTMLPGWWSPPASRLKHTRCSMVNRTACLSQYAHRLSKESFTSFQICWPLPDPVLKLWPRYFFPQVRLDTPGRPYWQRQRRCYGLSFAPHGSGVCVQPHYKADGAPASVRIASPRHQTSHKTVRCTIGVLHYPSVPSRQAAARSLTNQAQPKRGVLGLWRPFLSA